MSLIRAQEIISSRDTVSNLLRKSLTSRNVAEQKLMVREPRPMPQLQLKTGLRMFQGEWYAKKDWLCGSEEKNSLFCWPCLLFRPGGFPILYRDRILMQNILSDCKKHKKSRFHLEA